VPLHRRDLRRPPALPPARPEWLLLHAPFADDRGNVYHPYRTDFADFTATTIRAAQKVIVSVEQVVDHEWAVNHQADTLMPGWKVQAVVEAPFGCHPCGLGTLYDADVDHFRMYATVSRDPERFHHYLEEYVLSVKDHFGYLEKVGGIPRLMRLRSIGFGR
jgi:glutaconate CoA-transferase subunit A